MDIEKLIAEQERTNELLEQLRDAPSFKDFLSQISAIKLDYRDSVHFVDPWDFEGSVEYYNLLAGQFLRKGSECFGKLATCLTAVDNFYKDQTAQWEGYREHCLQKKDRGGYWTKYIMNPTCLEFFEKYEKTHGIEDSIYQQAQREKAKAEKRKNGEKD